MHTVLIYVHAEDLYCDKQPVTVDTASFHEEVFGEKCHLSLETKTAVNVDLKTLKRKTATKTRHFKYLY